MRVHEIFHSIQGEGMYQGIPMTFIRLQGCNLLTKCAWCDTSYAWDPKDGEEMSVEDILEQVKKLSPNRGSWICITGGEPLWQEKELEQLVRKLKLWGYQITIETNGSFKFPGWYTLVDSWNADIKCPSSGVCGVSNDIWFRTRQQDQIKFVVGTEEDLDFTRDTLNKHKADSPTILVSPVITFDKAESEIVEWLKRVVEFALENRLRFSLQWHKVIWGDKKGV